MRRIELNRGCIESGNLILINQTHPLRREMKREDLSAFHPSNSGVHLEKRPAKMLGELLAKLSGFGDILPVSGYRTQREQEDLYAESMRDNGRDYTMKYVALPGCSEHQTGLAVDLCENGESVDFICPDFPDRGICLEFKKVSSRYGFIQRYPAGREQITGIACEPWHFRYVGYPHSIFMEKEKLTLEEYIEGLKDYSFAKRSRKTGAFGETFELFYVPARQDGSVSFDISEKACFQVSGNNEDGVVVTLWRDGR